MARRRVYKNKQRRVPHGTEGKKVEHCDQERTKEIACSSEADGGRPASKVQGEKVYSNNKKYSRVRESCGDGHGRKQKYCSATGKGFLEATDIRKHTKDNQKGEGDEDQGWSRVLMSWKKI